MRPLCCSTRHSSHERAHRYQGEYDGELPCRRAVPASRYNISSTLLSLIRSPYRTPSSRARFDDTSAGCDDVIHRKRIRKCGSAISSITNPSCFNFSTIILKFSSTALSQPPCSNNPFGIASLFFIPPSFFFFRLMYYQAALVLRQHCTTVPYLLLTAQMVREHQARTPSQ